MQLVSTDVVKWREDLCRQFLRFDFEPSGKGSFHGCIEPILAGDGLRLARYSHTTGAVFRNKCVTKDGNDDLVLLLPTKSAIFVKQGDRETCIGIGRAVFVRNGEIGRAACMADNSVFALMLDPKIVNVAGEGLYSLVGQALPRTRNLAILRSYLVWLHRNGASLTSENSRIFGRQLVELVMICAAVDASAADKENDLSGARIRLANDFISQNFQDSCLSERHLAALQGITVRYLQ